MSIEEAQTLHRQGRLAEARAAYEQLLSQVGEVAEVYHRLALVMHQMGDRDGAARAATVAAELDPSQAHYHFFAGYLAHQEGDFGSARLLFNRAVERRPDWPAALRSLGEAWLRLGQPGNAELAFRRALALRPGDPGLTVDLAAALSDAGRVSEAVALCVSALEFARNHPALLFRLAQLAEMQGDIDDAFSWLEDCLRADPQYPPALLLRSAVLRRLGGPEGEIAHERACTALPDSAPAQIALADYQYEQGKISEAMASFRRAETLDPASFQAAAGARLTLPAIYRDRQHVHETRQRYMAGLDELADQASRFCRHHPRGLADASWINFFLAYQGLDDKSLQSSFGDLIHQVACTRVPQRSASPSNQPSRHRLRVGFFSHFFYNCTAGRYFASWIHDLDPSRFEKIVFYTNSIDSHDTRAISTSAERFHAVRGQTLEAVAERVMAEQLDILIFPELGMHADTFALAALRLAPIQLVAWGHPSSPGLPTIDGYLSCAEMEAANAQQHYREPLLLLPGLGTRYQRPQRGSSKSRSELGLPASGNLYLCPQSLFKIHPDNDLLFARVLAGDPCGHIVFFQGRSERVSIAFRRRLEGAMRHLGHNGLDRICFLGYMKHSDYLEVNGLAHVMLDTLHWSGGNTSLDAISTGLPIVTLPGELMRSRQSAAMLRLAGLPELVVDDADAYVHQANRVAMDAEWRYTCRVRLRQGSDNLFDDSKPTLALAAILERLHGERCDGLHHRP